MRQPAARAPSRFLSPNGARPARWAQGESSLSFRSPSASEPERSASPALRLASQESASPTPGWRQHPWPQPDSSVPRVEKSHSTDARLQAAAAKKHAEDRLASALPLVGAGQAPDRWALEQLAQAAATGLSHGAAQGHAVYHKSPAGSDSEAAELLLTVAGRARQESSRATPRAVPEQVRPDHGFDQGHTSPSVARRELPESTHCSAGVESGDLAETSELCNSESTDSWESSSERRAEPSARGVRRLHKGSSTRSVRYRNLGKAFRAFYYRKGTGSVRDTARRQHSRLEFTVEEKSPRSHSSRSALGTAEERILLYLVWLVDAMSTKKTAKKATPSPEALSAKAKQWEGVRRELEAKVTSLQDELTGMRKWCLAALGEAEKRTGELRAQHAATQRQLIEETQRKVEAIQAAEANMLKLQEEKKLKLMVYGQTLTKHKEMAEEAEELQQQLEDESAAREDAERRLSDAEAETEHLQSQLAHLEREFQLQLTQQHETTAATAEEYEAQIEKLQGEKSAAEALRVNLEQQTQVADASRRSLEIRIADMEAASTMKDRQLTNLQSTVEMLSAQLEDKTESVRKLDTEKHDMSLALSRETEAQRHLKERVNELTRDAEAQAARAKEFGDKHEGVYAQLTAATAALHDEQAKREKAESELIRLSAHSDLPAKMLSAEKAMQELQVKLGAAEAAAEIANVNVATWKDAHERLQEDSRKVQRDLETQLRAMTAKNEAKISELTEALGAEQTKSVRLERETSRLNEESTRLLETKVKQDGQIETLAMQVQDLRRLVSDKDADIAKFNATAKKLSQHIAELETKDTKSGHLIETTAAEKLRLSQELNVATQQLDMMREVTRQLYAKITEQVLDRFPS